MDDKGFVNTEGTCIISPEVIASIAKTATLEVAGVAGMAHRAHDIRGLVSSGSGRYVKVINNEIETIIDVFINLNEGVRIPDVSAEIQKNVKAAVQSMTGKPVTKVNIHIEDVVFDDDLKAEEAKED